MDGILCRYMHPDGALCPSSSPGKHRCPSCIGLAALTKLATIANHLELLLPDSARTTDPEQLAKAADFARMALNLPDGAHTHSSPSASHTSYPQLDPNPNLTLTIALALIQNLTLPLALALTIPNPGP